MTILIRLFFTLLVGLTFTLEVWACEPFPVNVHFSEIQNHSATVSWQKIDPNHVYQVSWRPKGQLSWNTSPVLNPDNDHFILTNLKDGTEYDVQVRSKCIAEPAFSPYAHSSLGFKTGSRLCAEDNPTPPNRFRLKSVNGKYAVVQWENISDAVGTHISYGLTNQPVSKWQESVLCKGEESFIIRDLKPNTSYLVRVRTLCTQCQTTNDPKKSRWTTVLLFKTTNDTTLAEPQQIVSGRVYDDHLQPIANAQVTVGAKKVQTDANGRYFIPFSWQERTMVKAEHPDFMTRTVGFYPTKADTVFCSVLMEQFKVTHTFNGKDAMLLGNTAFTVQLPENSIVDQTTGQAYTGTVKACITSARPGDPLFGERMPGGDFLAINAQGQERVLYSYGFFSCELRGENDQKLNLAPGVKASVAFQIAEDQQTKALPTMPLWHFDEQASIWKEEGTATKQGNTYIGEVSHFSSWNCDWQGPRCWVEGVLLLCEGTRARGGTAYADYMPAEADIEGKYRRWVPAEFPSPINVFTETTANQPYTLAANLPAEQTFIAPPMTIAPVRAIGIAEGNTAQIFASAIGTNDEKPTLEYSLDSTNWQASAMFTNLPEQDSYTCWVRVKGTDCVVKVEVVSLKKVCKTCGLRKYDGEFVRVRAQDYLTFSGEDEQYFNVCHVFQPEDYQLFESSFGAFKCVNGLEFNFQPLQSKILDKLSDFKYLQHLYLFLANGDTIPVSLGKMINLNYLALGGGISYLPPEISNCKQLQQLHLGGNSLDSLPAEIGKLSQLQSLSLHANSLTTLSAEIGKLSRLTSLYLSSNFTLTSLPPEISNLKENLKVLSLDGCPISEEEKAKIRSWLPNTQITF